MSACWEKGNGCQGDEDSEGIEFECENKKKGKETWGGGAKTGI